MPLYEFSIEQHGEGWCWDLNREGEHVNSGISDREHIAVSDARAAAYADYREHDMAGPYKVQEVLSDSRAP
jgi:hypothetical protein